MNECCDIYIAESLDLFRRRGRRRIHINDYLSVLLYHSSSSLSLSRQPLFIHQNVE